MHICMFVCVKWFYVFSFEYSYVSSYVCLFVRLHVCLFVCMFLCLYVCKLVCLFVCLFVRMFACLYVYVLVFCIFWMFVCTADFLSSLSTAYHFYDHGFNLQQYPSLTNKRHETASLYRAIYEGLSATGCLAGSLIR